METIYRAALMGGGGATLGVGVSWLVARLLRRRPQWLPLIPAGFATFLVAMTRPADPPPSAVMETLDKAPAFHALKTYYPDDYRRMEAEVLRARSKQQVLAASGAALGAVIVRERVKADPETAYALYEVARDEGRALRTVDARACAAFLDGKGDGGRLGPLMTPAMIDKDQQATARLFAQTSATPATPAAAMPMETLLQLSVEALRTLPEPEQDPAILVLREMRDPRTADEAKATCDFDLALADAILSRPKPLGGALVRALWAMK